MQQSSDEAQFMAEHYRLGHLSPAKMQQMARNGQLPARLATCRVPKCAACMYGKATQRPWRTKVPTNKKKVPLAQAPGDVVAVDHEEKVHCDYGVHRSPQLTILCASSTVHECRTDNWLRQSGHLKDTLGHAAYVSGTIMLIMASSRVSRL